MATHLAAYFQSIDSATLANINAAVDSILTRPATDRYQVPVDYKQVAWMAAVGANMTRAVLQSPSLAVRREVMEILPRARAALFAKSSPEICIPRSPLELKATENMTVQVAEDAAGASNNYAFIALKAAGDLPPMPAGDVRRVRCTSSTTLTANAWSLGTLTPDLDLEPGLYALVGMYGFSATGLAMRAVITGQNYRPGVLMLTTSESVGADFDAAMLDEINKYQMGVFAHTNIPQIEFFATAADTSEVVFLDVIRIGEAPGTS